MLHEKNTFNNKIIAKQLIYIEDNWLDDTIPKYIKNVSDGVIKEMMAILEEEGSLKKTKKSAE